MGESLKVEGGLRRLGIIFETLEGFRRISKTPEDLLEEIYEDFKENIADPYEQAENEETLYDLFLAMVK